MVSGDRHHTAAHTSACLLLDLEMTLTYFCIILNNNNSNKKLSISLPLFSSCPFFMAIHTGSKSLPTSFYGENFCLFYFYFFSKNYQKWRHQCVPLRYRPPLPHLEMKSLLITAQHVGVLLRVCLRLWPSCGGVACGSAFWNCIATTDGDRRPTGANVVHWRNKRTKLKL